jgi:hypothetical protein
MITNLNYKNEKIGIYHRITGSYDYKSRIHNFYCWVDIKVTKKGSYIKAPAGLGTTGRCTDKGKDLLFLENEDTYYSTNKTTGFFIWKKTHNETVEKHLRRYITSGLKKSLHHYEQP